LIDGSTVTCLYKADVRPAKSILHHAQSQGVPLHLLSSSSGTIPVTAPRKS
jgi:hypothetical protein